MSKSVFRRLHVSNCGSSTFSLMVSLATRMGCFRRGVNACKGKMTRKQHVVLYLDIDLVKKSKELGFNLSKHRKASYKTVEQVKM